MCIYILPSCTSVLPLSWVTVRVAAGRIAREAKAHFVCITEAPIPRGLRIRLFTHIQTEHRVWSSAHRLQISGKPSVRNRETSQVVLLFPWSPLHSLHAHLRNLDIVLSFWFEPLDRFYFSCYISWFTAATAQRMMIDHYFEIITDGWRWICFIGIRNLLLHKNDMRCTRNENQNNVITLVTCSQAL